MRAMERWEMSHLRVTQLYAQTNESRHQWRQSGRLAAFLVAKLTCAPRRRQPSVSNSDGRLSGDRVLSRTLKACWASRTSSACHRSTSPNQNTLSLSLLATAARRRHSSARRRNCSTLTSFLPADPPSLSGRQTQKLFLTLSRQWLKSFDELFRLEQWPMCNISTSYD